MNLRTDAKIGGKNMTLTFILFPKCNQKFLYGKKNHEKKTSEFYRQFIKILREKVSVLLYVTYNKNSEEQFIYTHKNKKTFVKGYRNLTRNRENELE